MHYRNRNFFRAALTLATLIVAPAACDIHPEFNDDLDEVLPRDSWGCPMWKCGFNAATVNGLDIGELNTLGLPNNDEVYLAHFRDGEDAGHAIRIQDDQILAINQYSEVLSGEQLIGFRFNVIKNGEPVTVVIVDVGAEDSWSVVGEPVVTYAFAYATAEGEPYKNVCSDNSDDYDATVATIIGDERYDLDTKTVTAEQTGWFSIACAGSALAKLKLMNYSPSALDDLGNTHDSGERQATLKMITADYCGTGHSFTVDGTPLLWQNHGGDVEYDENQIPDGATAQIEAIWDDKGAVCLNTPRVVDRSEVEEYCEIPLCDDGVFEGEWTTWSILSDA